LRPLFIACPIKYDPDKHHRRSIRLKHHDYTKSAAYFVTIAASNQASFFGDISNGRMQLNEFGAIVENRWKDLPHRFATVFRRIYPNAEPSSRYRHNRE
jgi:REP-associated tyrosine transposase